MSCTRRELRLCSENITFLLWICVTNVTHTTCHSVDIYQISDLMNWAIDLNQKCMLFSALCVPLFVSAVIIPLSYLLFVSIVTVFVYCVINIHTSSSSLILTMWNIFHLSCNGTWVFDCVYQYFFFDKPNEDWLALRATLEWRFGSVYIFIHRHKNSNKNGIL